MEKFFKGDILRGEKRKFAESFHPVVYVEGAIEAPLAVVLTHTKTEQIPCNLKLYGTYDDKPQYFVGHLIQKMSEWGPYHHKEGKLTSEDLRLVENTISGKEPITWAKYLDYQRDGCPDHKKV